MITIFSEGDEKSFLNAVIKSIGYEDKLDSIQFISTGGYTNLIKFRNKLEENNDFGNKNLIIFDADFEENGGGFKARLLALETQLSNISVKANIFLYPNNKDDGDFETLLEQCINPTHSVLLNCFEGYTDCISKSNTPKKKLYFVPNRKTKLYAYITSFLEVKKKWDKENERDFCYNNAEFWNLSSPYVKSLVDYLTKHL